MTDIKKNKSFLVIILFLFNLLLPSIFIVFGIQYPIFLQLIVELAIVIFSINLYKKKFRDSLDELKSHWIKYIFISMGVTVALIFLNTLLNSFIMNMFNIDIPNKTVLYQVQQQAPIYWILSVLFISPIMETLVIPVSFYELFSNKKTCYFLMSTLLYGLFYVMFSIKVPLQLFYVISYGIVGAGISLIYYKKNNIYLPLIIKFLYALFTVLIFTL